LRHYASEKTVRLLVWRQTGPKKQILLVHEKDEKTHKDERGRSGKPGGWSLPGGGIKSEEDEIWAEIEKLLASHVRLSKGNGADRPLSPAEYAKYYKMIEEGFPIFSEVKVRLTAIKEGIEETGLLVKPLRELFREPTLGSFNNHENVFLECEEVAGLLQIHSSETDDAWWFDEDNLPTGSLPVGLYKRHRSWIKLGLEIIQQREFSESEKEVFYE